MTIHGSCLCGKARYEIEGEITQVDHCHCTFCQKTHGAAFGSYAQIEPGQFRWVGSTGTLGRFQSSTHSARVFCTNCGSTLLSDINGGAILAVTLGTLDNPPPLPSGFHIFVRSKAPWYTINDGLPQYPLYPPEFSGIQPTDQVP